LIFSKRKTIIEEVMVFLFSILCQEARTMGYHVLRRTLLLPIAVWLVLAAGGCSGSAGSDKDVRPDLYTANLGTATQLDFREKTRKMLDRYQFQVIRYEQTTDATFFETEWKMRYPFEDELQQNVEEARTRLIITATPRTRAPMGSDLHTVRLEAENQVRYRDGRDWHYLQMSEMLKAYLKEFCDKLSTEFRSGIRTY
jgi:hypothetical protein